MGKSGDTETTFCADSFGAYMNHCYPSISIWTIDTAEVRLKRGTLAGFSTCMHGCTHVHPTPKF
eukprot:7005521-Pyramimonas_sp.AAC.2